MNAFEHVVVGLDMHHTAANAVLARACELAEPSHIEAVHACTIFHHEHHDYTVGAFGTTEALDAAVRARADEYLASVCEPLGITRCRVLDGRAAGALHDYAREHADLVVVGSHGHHGARALFASTSNAMIHGTPCDVLAVHIDDDRPDMPASYRKVLAAVDLSDESFQVMEEANRVALHCGATLAVCNVSHRSDDPFVSEAVERLGRLADSFGIDEDEVFEPAGHVGPCVHDLAREIGADLIVVGTHGKQGLQLLTGSTANAVLRGSRCDVLAARVH